MKSFNRDNGEVLDYTFDWTNELNGDTISSSTWTVSPSSLYIQSTSSTTTTATVWVIGGTSGVSYTLKNTIVTAGGRTEKRTLQLVCVDNHWA